ncbi:MAG TPA: alpha-ketoglutarate-dependent dioxygenase AlkB [Acidimicrobiales bacterium]|nr:alpha-ketoglutarate-dependent dioxygenase AlkB [Acidimicrobiales bacterium]
MSRPSLAWQPRLPEGAGAPTRLAISGDARQWLDSRSWIDHVAEWLPEADAVFAELLDTLPWEQRTRRMYDGDVLEPRLTASWKAGGGATPLARGLAEARQCLSAHYGVVFDSVGFNLYRDGRDSVAWHRDKIPQSIVDPIVVLVSLGEPRRLLLRPRGGGSSHRFSLGTGDLLVTGGRTQRDWEHTVPKVSSAGPRISVAFRHTKPASTV